MTVNGKHSSVVFRYEHGRIFQQADLAGTVVDEGQKPSGVKIVFRGRVTVRSQTTVKAYSHHNILHFSVRVLAN